MLVRLVNLSERDILLVRGPASVKCERSTFLLGIDVGGREISVRAGKVLPFEVSGASRAKIALRRGGGYRVARGRRFGVSIWEDVARVVSSRRLKRIMLLGATDTGKSTLAPYLSNIALSSGSRVSVVDGDVGQGDLAPPGCIGSSTVRGHLFDLRDLDAEQYAFIGAISPTGVEDLVIRSMKSFAERFSSRSDICIINTDGYIDERGIDYKVELARVLEPDLLVYLGSKAKARRLLDEFKDRVVYANAPAPVSKTHREREERRLEQYRRFIEGGSLVTFGIGSRKFGLMGRLDDAILSADDSVVTIGSARFPAWLLKGMFVGLSSAGTVRGFAVVQRVVHGRMTLRTRYEGEFDTVLLSTVRLLKNMREEYHIPLQQLLLVSHSISFEPGPTA